MPHSKPQANKQSIVVLRNMPLQQSLQKANKVLLLLVALLMAVVLLLGVLLLPAGNTLENYHKQKSQALATAVANPALAEEINNFKGRFVGLLSGSIESKLRVLKSNIQNGKTGESMAAVDDLQKQIQLLQTYVTPSKPATPSDTILQEVSQLKKLLYFILSSCGIIIAALGGIWIKRHYRLVYYDNKTNKRWR